jgi:predicted transposase YdaD
VLQPDNSTYERSIARDALSVQDYKTAYQAVQRVLVLEPTAPDKKQLTTLLKQLKPLIGITTASGSTGSP